jgi:hypothetical protein
VPGVYRSGPLLFRPDANGTSKIVGIAPADSGGCRADVRREAD